jgi:hydroxyacylglutathione hydrolase
LKIIRRYMNNRLRNFNYLIGCEETKQAIALDPLDGEAMVALAAEQGWQIKLIINTHEHHDHIEGNPAVQAATGAEIWASEFARGKIPNMTRGLMANEEFSLGSMAFKVLPTPGHTPVHVCLLTLSEDVPILFSGDTLFNASAGNCFNGGDVDEMYDTFVRELSPLPGQTLLFPGHDYMKTNLDFALSCEPKNEEAEYWQGKVDALSSDEMPYMTLGQEREYNPFLRLQSPHLLTELQGQSERETFKALRAKRDVW